MNTEVSAKNGNLSDGNSGHLIQSEPRGISLVEIIENVYFFRWFFLGTFAIITSLAILYALFASPVYTADALIQVEEKKGAALGALKDLSTALGSQQSPILGELEIIRSRTVIGEAVDALKANITVTVDNRLPIIGNWLARVLDKGSDGLAMPPWGGSALAWGGEDLKILHMQVPPKMYGESLFLIIGPNNTWVLNGENGKTLLTGEGLDQQAQSADKQFSLTLGGIRARPGTVFKMKVYSIQSRIARVLSSVTVAETKRQSNIIKISYENTNPDRAAAMLSAITDAYVGQNISRRSAESEKSLQFLNKELPRLKGELELDEQVLTDYRSQNKTVDIPSEVKELLTQVTNVEKARLDLELKLKEYQTRYQPDHPLLKGVNFQLAQLRSQTGQMDHQISQLPQVQQDYIRKERDVQVNNQLYVSLLNNAQQLQIAKAGTIGNVFVVDPAVVPEKPSRPIKPLVVAIGALLGFMLGFVVCQGLAFLSGIVRDPKKLELEVGLTTLAILPISQDQVDAIEESDDTAVYMLSQENPTAIPVEALRSLRTSTLFALSEKPRSKVILITSAVPSQGKSFISANLSYLLASTNKRVLLIEADIRKASLRRYISHDKKDPGLTAVLRGERDLESVILKAVYPNLDFLPAGKTVKNPGDILSSDTMSHLIHALAERYDFVVIDSPPLLPVNDSRSLATAADVTLFVARQEMTSVAEIREAIEIFERGGSKIDGLVFNGFVPSQIRYGYNYGYGYRNYGLYGRYGKYGGKYGKYGKYGQTYGSHKVYRYKDYGPKDEDES
ncbi:polysaccharide biosynthesis tyrosine autokinase [Polynucleobacter sphagniphilus]|uniref:polysaccharide biosynthesis tyrosine autokinase n=1 Tax=Polynucleobacter sphagniphilus TaxID=1743169 RepID=UPI0024738FDB|nr:polysaccharide biosynthesis tyrosine autokinase [Polynucleobacter sphagniphilus]MDH6525563.1 tyrosine-protein kinase Etk/Wzc [Polynucleobacter sphagniphilus]